MPSHFLKWHPRDPKISSAENKLGSVHKPHDATAAPARPGTHQPQSPGQSANPGCPDSVWESLFWLFGWQASDRTGIRGPALGGSHLRCPCTASRAQDPQMDASVCVWLPPSLPAAQGPLLGPGGQQSVQAWVPSRCLVASVVSSSLWSHGL